MLKKAIPVFLLSGLVLGGCMNNDNTVPNNNETPMEDVQDRDRNWTPNANDNQNGGTNLDGIDNGREDNGVNNDNNTNGVINEGTMTEPDGAVIDDDLNRDRNGNNR